MHLYVHFHDNKMLLKVGQNLIFQLTSIYHTQPVNQVRLAHRQCGKLERGQWWWLEGARTPSHMKTHILSGNCLQHVQAWQKCSSFPSGIEPSRIWVLPHLWLSSPLVLTSFIPSSVRSPSSLQTQSHPTCHSLFSKPVYLIQTGIVIPSPQCCLNDFILPRLCLVPLTTCLFPQPAVVRTH